LLAWQTQIGQIFRLQNYEEFAKKIADQKLLMEGIAITALSVNKDSGIITGIVVETGGSSSLIGNFKENEPCIFMGPSGKPTDIAINETVIMIGGGRGNQPLNALAEAFSANGCKVIFFAGYRQSEFIVNLNRMKNSCAELIIAIEEKIPAQEISKNNFFQGNIIEAIKNYFTKNPLKIDRIFAIGNDNLMHEIARLRHDKIIQSFASAKYAIASLNAPMQCMMKGVCGKCLQKKINQNGEEEYFYSCANQDQSMDELDFEHLHNRCEQNSLLEKTSKSWLQFLENSEVEKNKNILKN
jgi:NAD(P)H-flavin reductase